MPRTTYSEALEALECLQALVSMTDEAARILAMREREPHNIAELKRIRAYLKRMKTILERPHSSINRQETT